MIVIDSDYTCTLSKVTFKHIINSLYFEQKHILRMMRVLLFLLMETRLTLTVLLSLYTRCERVEKLFIWSPYFQRGQIVLP